MASQEDINALKASEIWTSYIETELKKEAYDLALKAAEDKRVSETAAENFLAFQDQVNTTPHLKRAFKEIQTLLATNPEYAKTVDASFVNGVMLLKIDE